MTTEKRSLSLTEFIYEAKKRLPPDATIADLEAVGQLVGVNLDKLPPSVLNHLLALARQRNTKRRH